MPPLSASDSGFYSSCNPGSPQTSFNSFATVDSESDLVAGAAGAKQSTRRRLSSNADIPDYGSWCSLHRRWMASMETGLAPADQSGHQLGSSPGIRHSHNDSLK